MTEKKQSDLRRLLSYMKPYKGLLALAFLFLVGATVTEMMGPFLIKQFLDEHLVPRNFDQSALVTLFVVYIVAHLLKVLFTYLDLLYFQNIAFKIVQDMRVEVYEHVQKLSLSFFDRTPIGTLVSRITNDTEAIKDFYVSVLSTFVKNIVFLVGILVAMFLLNVKLALFSLVLIPIMFAIMVLYRRKSAAFYLEVRNQLSVLNAKLNESIQGMNIVQVFRQEKRMRKEFEEVNNKHYSAGRRTLKLDALLLRPATDLVHIVAIALVLGLFGIDALKSPVEVGVLYAFVNYIHRFFQPVNEMMMKLSFFQQALVSSSRVFHLMDEKDLAPVQKGDGNPQVVNGDIEFKNVTFSYDGKRDVLKNVSFHVKQGQTVAFVGHTGSGKSTIMNLLMRFYNIKSGNIVIDGVDLEKFEEQEIRKKIGLVLQDAFLFAGNVKQNIRMYNEEITDEEVKEAAQFVQANTFIEKLPEQYETEVVERGAAFSSGQRQLIAFARTIATNPKVLVLDEATANIDTETEDAIQTALQQMRKGRTTIAIAHRLSTIQDADQIFVMHDGEIVERGTHQELLSEQGLYYNMYLLQNKGSLQKAL
ncbi:TPA: ABC transporter ATP-binding protein [Bacillus anthracis]|uniref:Multidrug ABC transporter ATP-binding protein n=1 Tax=Bacillus thuringiensis serovar vazensis TaxID=180867 RepID=A0A243D0D8_BACTU|nr:MULTISPECIES: ABC transporter ATP-binding protein [Bacillus]COE90189.1 multidrug ABC transporter ATPase/permease [Streptococcus pneumoniae]HDR6230300.1 ABC transporter ATP-binding protein [Bacillus cereus biovar anthracis]ARZ63743.1 multidrug ABC transporter ATP-binding protein [Bacillus thuringiensis]AXO99591.1 ABC transporter ATP-binding protein [Bacillus anthracis]EEM88586.1 ABC-type multidrug protein lipid transport system ATPase component [Bacillus thuringiensis serovar pulsiensis BGSC